MPTARFEADFSGFIAAINASQIALVDFNKGAETVQTTLNKMTDEFSGRQVIQEASLMVIAVEKLGGVSALTADELQTVGAKAQEAAEKLRAMGSDVPAGIQKYADAAQDASGSTQIWSAATDVLTGALSSLGVTAGMAGLVEWFKAVGEQAAQIENLGARFQTTTDDVQKFQEVAASTDVPMHTMVSAFQGLQEKLGDPKRSGSVIQGLTDLKINVEDFMALSPWNAYVQLATAIGGIEDPQRKAHDELLLFGNAFKQLAPALDAAAANTSDNVNRMSTDTVGYFASIKHYWDDFWKDVLNQNANGIQILTDFGAAVRQLEAMVKAIPTPKEFLPQPTDIKPTTQSMEELTDVGNQMTATLEAQLKVNDAYQKSLPGITLATDDWRKTLDGLDGSVVDYAEHLLQLGAKAKDVQGFLDLSDAAMAALAKDIKEGGPAIAAAFDAANAAAQNWHDTLNNLSGDVIEGTEYYLRLGLTVQQTALIMQQSVKDTQAVKNGMAEAATATNALQKAEAEYNDYLAKSTEDSTTYQIQKIWDRVNAEESAFKGSADQRAAYNKIVEALADAQTDAVVAAAYKTTAAVAKSGIDAASALTKSSDAATQHQIDNIWKIAAEQEKAYQGDNDATAANDKMIEDLATQQANYLISEAQRFQHSWSDVMDQTVTDAQGASQKIQSFKFTPGTQDEQQAMSAAIAEVDATNIGQMIKQGTQSIALINEYEAAIEQAMAQRGYSVGGGLTPAAQAAGYGGTAVNTTVNVNGSVLSTPAQLSTAVSAALADAMRRAGISLPSQ